MKKVAFILALAFVFLVGEKIVFEHKIWAEDKIVYWIPVNEDGKFVLDKIKPEGKYKKRPPQTYPVPHLPVQDWLNIESIHDATSFVVKKNPSWCWITCQEGSCVEECYP